MSTPSTNLPRISAALDAVVSRMARPGDGVAATAPARRRMRSKFERLADPDGVLPPHERACRADQLQHAHMLRMALASARARRRRPS